MHLDDPDGRLIIAFLERIGIGVTLEPLSDDTFLPGIAIRDGALVADPAKLRWPSDLLHEAGHIAVTAPEDRPTLNQVRDDPGEEMAALAWSYAAALEIGLDPRILFHDDYRGGGAALASGFAAGRGVGAPMLAWFGMCSEPHRRDDPLPAYPKMARWLR